VPRTLDESDVAAVQAAADASGRAHVAVLVDRAAGPRWACAVRVFQPRTDTDDDRVDGYAA
jgi:hypothetical protein